MANFNSQQLTTVRVSFPKECMENVVNIKVIGNDVLFYVKKEVSSEFNTSIKNMGLSIVGRLYKIHVSAPTKEVFESIFKKYLEVLEFEERGNQNRFIITINVTNEEDYRKYLELDSDVCLVRPYKTQYNNRQMDDKKPQIQNMNWMNSRFDNKPKFNRPYYANRY